MSISRVNLASTTVYQDPAGAGFVSTEEHDTTCRYANQTEFWIDGYTILADASSTPRPHPAIACAACKASRRVLRHVHLTDPVRRR